MRSTLLRWLDAIRTGFWFLPMVMLAAACLLAVFLLDVDRRLDPGINAGLAWAYSGGPEGARSLLSTIAGSMITAASVTFSLASVALSIASQQYGSRVLRNFMRDGITQVLLGTFVSTFIYSVLVVRAIRGTGVSGGFVPAISVTVAIVLSLVSLVLLIYFIHHISASIQASRIIRVIAEELQAEIPRLYPSDTGEPARGELPLEAIRAQGSMFVSLEQSGYIQTIDLDTLLDAACAQNVVLKLLVKPGDHLLAGALVAEVLGKSQCETKWIDQVLKAFYLDHERSPAQDIRYHYQQIADVSVRALSPGINDPFTAINAIDELAASMLQFARRGPVPEPRKDSGGQVRLVVATATAGDILRETVGHIALYATADHFVMDALRRVLDSVRPHLQRSEDLDAVQDLQRQLDRLQSSARR